jgi:hypothetical protein
MLLFFVMRSLTSRIGQDFGAGYSDSRLGTLTIKKSVDITDECPKRVGKTPPQAVVVDFAESTRGTLVCLNDHYPGKDYGSSLVNSLADLREREPRDELVRQFKTLATMVGLDYYNLLDRIETASTLAD